jgi:Flp pilus assembly secretin CpaC
VQGCAVLWCVGNLERIQIGSVNAPIVADGQLVTPLDVTAAADGLNNGVGQEGVDEGFHCSCCLCLSLGIKAKGCDRPAVRDAVALLNLRDF